MLQLSIKASITFITQGNLILISNKQRLYGSVVNQKLRDQQKKEICSKAGITMIDIGYWWDLEKSTIQATLHKYRLLLFID